MAGPNCQAVQGGEMVQQRTWARHGFYRRGEVKEINICVVVSGRGGAVLEHGNLSSEVSQVRSESKMAANLLFYHSPIFSLTMMRVGAEDQELGQSIGLFSYFLLAGDIVWGRILRLLWRPGWAFTVVFFQVILERLISLEVQLVKFLFSSSRHVV
jgi:hypothetical protein